MSYNYKLSGFVFETNISFPELVSTNERANGSILVIGSVSEKVPEEALTLPFYRSEILGLQCVRIKQLGFIAIWNNNDIEYMPADGIEESAIRNIILGTITMFLASGLGYISFHAACVIVNEKAVLFCGRSGNGKSSLAAYFYSCGYPVLADDLTNIKLSETGEILAFPSVPRIKLTEKMLINMGKTTEGLHALPARSKYSLSLNQLPLANYPVAMIVFPEFYSGKNKLEPVLGKDKLIELRNHLFRKKYSRLLDFHEHRNKILFRMATQLEMRFFLRSDQQEEMKTSFNFIEKELVDLLHAVKIQD